MGIGISTDYVGSPLTSGGSSQLTLWDTPGATGTPISTPDTGISGAGLSLEQPSASNYSLDSGGSGDSSSLAGTFIGAGVDLAGTIVEAALTSSQNDEARKTARELAEMRRADEWANIRQNERLHAAGLAISRQGIKQQEKETDLVTKHNRFMAAFKKQLEKNQQAHQLMDNVGELVYRNSNMRKKLIRGWSTT